MSEPGEVQQRADDANAVSGSTSTPGTSSASGSVAVSAPATATASASKSTIPDATSSDATATDSAPGTDDPSSEVGPSHAVLGPFTMRELVFGGGVLIMFIGTLLPFVGGRVLYTTFWSGASLFFVGIGILLPVIALALLAGRRLGSAGLRVGSLSVDQFASVTAVLAATFFFLQTVTAFQFGALLALVGSLGLLAATVAGPLLPVLKDDFADRPEVAAHPLARPITAAKPRPPKPAKPADTSASDSSRDLAHSSAGHDDGARGPDDTVHSAHEVDGASHDSGSGSGRGGSRGLGAGGVTDAGAGARLGAGLGLGAGAASGAAGAGAGAGAGAAPGSGAASSSVSGPTTGAGGVVTGAPTGSSSAPSRSGTTGNSGATDPGESAGVPPRDEVPGSSTTAIRPSDEDRANDRSTERTSDGRTSERAGASGSGRTWAGSDDVDGPDSSRPSAIEETRVHEAIGGNASPVADSNNERGRQEPITATRSAEEEHVVEAFWFAVGSPRPVFDEDTGREIFILQPGDWEVGIEDRGRDFLVQDKRTGAVGILRDLRNIERAPRD